MKERTLQIISDFYDNNPDLVAVDVKSAINVIVNAAKQGKKILLCGNGGSAADCEHFSGELLKSFVLKRPIKKELKEKLIKEYGDDGLYMADNMQSGVKCIPLTSFLSYNTAFLNDCNDKMLFAQLVQVLGDADDVLIAFSTSGNSANVVAAAKVARVLGIKVIAVTGKSGGKLKYVSDISLFVPTEITFRVQEYHLPIYHCLCLAVESELFEE